MFKLLPLGYSYDSLKPFIDPQTMEIHYLKDHQTYVDKLNAALEKYPEWQNISVEELLTSLDKIPEEIRTQIRNHGGGHYNHSFFWPILKINQEVNKNEIIELIEQQFGNFDQFKAEFIKSATGLFGSGWTWLVWSDNNLEIMNTTNQDSPVSVGKIPLLTVDVWEHAYYLQYQNLRPMYLEAFFKVINWEKVNENYLEVKK